MVLTFSGQTLALCCWRLPVFRLLACSNGMTWPCNNVLCWLGESGSKWMQWCGVSVARPRGIKSPWCFLQFMQTRPLLITKRVLPCVFDPANGRAGCSFYDTDKLLHATPHCPLASSHLTSVSLFIIPHGSTKLHMLPFVADVAWLCPAARSRGRRPCLARNDCSWNSKQKVRCR